MDIRVAGLHDLDVIMNIYSIAREFMKKTGNGNQWINGYPSEELIRSAIEDGSHYVCTCGDQVFGTFYFKVAKDENYATIYNGKWLNDESYGVVHRLASNGKQKGIADFCLQWCFEQCANIRVDTHKDNAVMQNVLRRSGYVECGIIYVSNGTERVAFQKSNTL